MADASYLPKAYRERGGDRYIVADGGTILIESGGTAQVESGGTLQVDSGATFTVAGSTNIGVQVTAATGTTIVAGDFVYVSGWDTSNEILEVTEAKADAAATARDLYWAPSTIAADAQGYVYKVGALTADVTGAAVNTDSGNVGEPVYLSDGTAGLWTLTEPTGTDYVVQIGVIAVKSATVGVISIDLGGEVIPVHDHADDAGGGTLSTPALAGTTSTTFKIDSSGHYVSLSSSGQTADHVFTYHNASGEVVVQSAGVILNTITDLTNVQHDHSNTAGGGSVTATGLTGTTQTTFKINSGGSYLELSSSGLTGNKTFTFPDTTGVVLTEAATQDVSGKTLNSCTFASGTLSGTFTGTVTMSGDWTNLGGVADCDINGGAIDGVIIGAASAAAGTFTTLTASTLTDGTFSVSSGAVTGMEAVTSATGAYNFDYSASTGTFKTSTGEVTLEGNVTIAATKTLTTAADALVQLLGDVEIKADLDTATGVQMVIGGTAATGIAINRTGQTLTMNGNVDQSATGSATLASGDSLFFIDATASNVTKKETMDNVATLLAGTGLSAASSVIALDLNGLGAAAVDVTADSIAIIDANASNASKKESIDDLVTALAGTGLANSSSTFAVDLNGLSAEATFDPAADYVAIVDVTDSGSDKTLWTAIATAVAGTGITASSGVLNIAAAPRTAMALDNASVYRIPLQQCRTQTGLVMDATGGAGLFKITNGGFGVGTLILEGETANGNTKTDTLCFEFSLPPEYVADDDVVVAVEIKADDSGAANLTTETLQIEAYELADAGTAGGDLAAGGAQDLSGGSDAFQTITSAITDTGLGAGDKLIIFVQAVLTEDGSGNANVEIGNVEVRLDIQG